MKKIEINRVLTFRPDRQCKSLKLIYVLEEGKNNNIKNNSILKQKNRYNLSVHVLVLEIKFNLKTQYRI
jgi:hypothetical protein